MMMYPLLSLILFTYDAVVYFTNSLLFVELISSTIGRCFGIGRELSQLDH